MSGDIIRDFAPQLVWLLSMYKILGWFLGVLAGFTGLISVARAREDKEQYEVWLSISGAIILVVLGLQFGLPYAAKKHFDSLEISLFWFGLWAVFFLIGVAFGVFWLRIIEPKIAIYQANMKKKSEHERDTKTDVRTVRELLPETPDFYDIMDFFEQGTIAAGLDKEGKPIRLPYDFWKNNHIQLAGTTGSGKGVAAQMGIVQSVAHGESVFIFDPKNDEWLPHVLHDAAEKFGVPYHFIDLRDGKEPQINPLHGVSRADLKELLIAAFALSDKGTEADHYRLADRKAAGAAAAFIEANGGTFASRLGAVATLPEVEAAGGFLGKWEEMAELDSINAPVQGLDIEQIVKDGGIVYIVGSMRQDIVKRALRMLMVRLVQVCEQRDRIDDNRPVLAFLDELKYHLSKPAMEIFGAARDKGLHALVAHQSQGDLRDVPHDLDADAVVGSVIENTAIKLIYKVQDPDTAKWIAERSGTKIVDEEMRKVDRNVALSDMVDGDRTVRQSETNLVDTNMLMNLPDRVAVLFSKELPEFVGTSPILVEKNRAAVQIESSRVHHSEAQAPQSPQDAGSLDTEAEYLSQEAPPVIEETSADIKPIVKKKRERKRAKNVE